MQNWNVFQDGVMKESSLNDVIQHHFDKRLFMYEKRKTYQLQVMETSRVSLLEKIKFLEAFVQGFIPITTSSDHELHAICTDLGLNPKFLDLPMRSLQPSNIKRLKTEMEALLVDIQTLQSKSSVDLWKCDLMDLKKEVYRGDLHNKRGASVL